MPRKEIRARARIALQRNRFLRLTIGTLLAGAVVATGIVVAPAIAAPTTTGIFADDLVPAVAADPDRVPVELGVRFTPEKSGDVIALQYYQGERTAAVTQATLWGADGAVLARASFSASKTVGWRTVALDRAVTLKAGSTYVASYNAPRGGYVVTERQLDKPQRMNGFSLSTGAGVYRYGKTTSLPTSTYQGSNYLVDVVYRPSATDPGVVTPPSPTASPTATPKPTVTPSPTATATPTPTPTATPKPTPTTAPTTAPTTPPSVQGCIGAANTPGGPDPWGGCWPGPQNTGYPQGLPGDTRQPVTLTPYTGPTTIRSCGVVIDSKLVNTTLIIEAGNGSTSPSTPCVTIKNSLVKGVIFAEKTSYGPVVVTDTEVSPTDLPWWENIGRSNVFVTRVNSNGGEGVVKCDSNCAVVDSWIHGMRLGGQYHYNAIGGNGTDGFKIEHNYASCGDWSVIENPGGDAGCSAVIGFYGDYAPASNITINRNFLASTFDTSPSGIWRQAGYCLNPGYYPGKPYGTTNNMIVTDNVFARGGSGKCGVYGPTNSLNKKGASNGNVWQGNRYSDGTPIGVVEE
ncbi:DUF4082 domain-containing protein [Microbacterium sp. CJ88]|uniref:DUF4082 domain-containing protein n=1 Tax=Microbacterium sp. CJ88 TaxID=3445672 RepID=UPI003F655333